MRDRRRLPGSTISPTDLSSTGGVTMTPRPAGVGVRRPQPMKEAEQGGSGLDGHGLSAETGACPGRRGDTGPAREANPVSDWLAFVASLLAAEALKTLTPGDQTE